MLLDHADGRFTKYKFGANLVPRKDKKVIRKVQANESKPLLIKDDFYEAPIYKLTKPESKEKSFIILALFNLLYYFYNCASSVQYLCLYTHLS